MPQHLKAFLQFRCVLFAASLSSKINWRELCRLYKKTVLLRCFYVRYI